MRREGSVFILSELELDDIEEVVWEPYHRDGPGKPPRNPMGIFKALVVKRLRQIPSDRELYRRLWDDPILREISDIEAHEKPYHPSQLTRFRRRVGQVRLEGIMNRLVGELVDGGVVSGVEDVIPYPANQRRGEDVLRVDKHFKANGLARERSIYGRVRSSIERVSSRLKDLVGLDRHRVRGLRNITVHVALCRNHHAPSCGAVLRLNMPEKARSIASFGWR